MPSKFTAYYKALFSPYLFNLQVSINGLDVTKINFSVIIFNLSFLQLRFSNLTNEIPDWDLA